MIIFMLNLIGRGLQLLYLSYPTPDFQEVNKLFPFAKGSPTCS